MSFERHLRHRNKQDESMFTGWHAKEVFAVPIVRLLDLYELVTDCWYDLFEMLPVFTIANQMVYTYFASATSATTCVRSPGFDAILVAEYALQDFMIVVGFAQWGTRHHNFNYNLIWRPVAEIIKFTCTFMRQLTQRVEDLRRHWNKVALIAIDPRVAHFLLALRCIEEVNWDATFRDVKTSGLGR